MEKETNKKYTVEVEIPEVDKDGSCGDCPLLVYVGQDFFECALDLGETIEQGSYGDFYPGKMCPRYSDSQEKRK